MRRLIPLLCLAAACGGSSSNSLQGAGSFSPNATNAVQPFNSDGTLEANVVQIYVSSSTPPFTCAFADAGIPASVVINGVVEVDIALPSTLQPGTFSITDPTTFSNSNIPTGGFAAAGLFGPATPPSNLAQETESSVSGTLTLTHVGTEWAGTFTATMAILDGGGQTSLSGSFDTTSTCN